MFTNLKKEKIFLLVLFVGVALGLGYKLDNYTLQPWDEAWYAVISRNIIKTGNWLDLQFNGKAFWDHPPLGFWITSVFFKIFGINEVSARLGSVLLTAGTSVLLYLSGKKLGGWRVGVMAVMICLSSRWLLLRARTNNLDALLLFTQVLVFYQVMHLNHKRDVYKLWGWFGLALLAKSAISITLLPLVLLGTFGYYRKDKTFKIWEWISVMSMAVLVLYPWYGYNWKLYGEEFIKRNVWTIGLRGASSDGVSIESIRRTLLYLHSAIHKWYSIFGISLVGGLIVGNYKKIGWVYLYLFLTAFPYFVSTKTEIWHLIPIVGPMALLIPLVAVTAINKIALITRQQWIGPLGWNVALIGVAAIAISSIKAFWPEMWGIPKSVSNEAKIAIEANKYDTPLLLQDNTYFPTVVFYADRIVEPIDSWKSKELNQRKKPFQLITKRYLLDGVTGYEEKYQIGDTLLVSFPE